MRVAWDIILQSFGVILVIMLLAQGLHWLLGGRNGSADGEEQ